MSLGCRCLDLIEGKFKVLKNILLTDLGWLVTLLFRGSILTDSGRLVFFLGVR
jgi:hypothetical protein